MRRTLLLVPFLIAAVLAWYTIQREPGVGNVICDYSTPIATVTGHVGALTPTTARLLVEKVEGTANAPPGASIPRVGTEIEITYVRQNLSRMRVGRSYRVTLFAPTGNYLSSFPAPGLTQCPEVFTTYANGDPIWRPGPSYLGALWIIDAIAMAASLAIAIRHWWRLPVPGPAV